MKSLAYLLLMLLLGLSSVHAQATAKPAEEPAPTAATTPGAPAPVPPVVTRVGDKAKPSAGYIPAAQSSSPVMTLWQLVESGGWAMIPLAFLSFLTVMFVLIFTASLRRSSILTTHYMNTADVLLKKRDYLGLLAISSRHSEAVARVVQRALDFATKNSNAPFEVVKDVAESEASAQAAALQHKVSYLADIGTLSPMVGLLGTVIGIVRSFGSLANPELAKNRDWAMAAGVSEALVATGAGLIIGIIAFAFYALFRNKVQRLISDLEVASTHIVGLIAINYNKKREPSRSAFDDE